MQTSEFQKNIIQNIRGFYLTQIISHLGKLGFLDKILNDDIINLKKNKLNFSTNVLKTIFEYFSNIGFAKKIKDNYLLTELGRDVLFRDFCIFGLIFFGLPNYRFQDQGELNQKLQQMLF